MECIIHQKFHFCIFILGWIHTCTQFSFAAAGRKGQDSNSNKFFLSPLLKPYWRGCRRNRELVKIVASLPFFPHGKLLLDCSSFYGPKVPFHFQHHKSGSNPTQTKGQSTALHQYLALYIMDLLHIYLCCFSAISKTTLDEYQNINLMEKTASKTQAFQKNI